MITFLFGLILGILFPVRVVLVLVALAAIGVVYSEVRNQKELNAMRTEMLRRIEERERKEAKSCSAVPLCSPPTSSI